MARLLLAIAGQLAALDQAHGLLGPLVQVLVGQAQRGVDDVLVRQAIATGEEDACVHDYGESLMRRHGRLAVQVDTAAALQSLGRIGPTRLRRLGRDRPVGIRRARHTLEAGKHVVLADVEGADVGRLGVGVVGQGLGGIARRVLGQNRQAQQRSHTTAALGQRAGVDLDVALVENGKLAAGNVKAIAAEATSQAELVPEAAAQHNGVELEIVQLGGEATEHLAKAHLVVHGAVVRVGAVGVGHDPLDTSLGGSGGELDTEVTGRAHGERDDEKVLAGQGLDEAAVVIVVDNGLLDTLGDHVLAISAGEGGNCVLAGLE